MACLLLIGALCMEWRFIKKAKEQEGVEAAENGKVKSEDAVSDKVEEPEGVEEVVRAGHHCCIRKGGNGNVQCSTQ